MKTGTSLLRHWPLLLVALTLCFGVAWADVPVGPPQAQLFLERMPTPQEVAQRDTRAKFEPPVGCYLGAFIDFDGSLKSRSKDQNRTEHVSPTEFEQIVGKPHAMYFFYLGYGRPVPLDWLQALARQNKFVHIALEPNNGLGKVKDDAYLRKLASDMQRSGAKIFLRFASEMNGPWTNYHNNPKQYREKFRLVHQVMRRLAPNVATVWCPYMEPIANIASYYPGDDGTDWVGVNLYNVTYHNNDIAVNAEREHPADLLRYVYNRYAARKPVMVCEYAATHYGACEGRPRPDFAYRKILTLYNALPRLYPRVKCINYFDSNNVQFVASRAYNDYSVTDDPIVVGAYRYAVSAPYYLTAPALPNPPAPFPGRPLRFAREGGEKQGLRVGTGFAVPMAVRKGELLRGRVRLSCWARTPSDVLTVRYKVDGYRIYQANRPDQWECYWQADSVKPGRHTLTLEVINTSGKIAASQSLPIQTAR